jgi:hypothetical protein
MSDPVDGVISLSPNQNGVWFVRNNASGWHGNCIIQPEVIAIGAGAVPLTVNLFQYRIQALPSSDGSYNYQWWIAIQNESPTTVLFQLQCSFV